MNGHLGDCHSSEEHTRRVIEHVVAQKAQLKTALAIEDSGLRRGALQDFSRSIDKDMLFYPEMEFIKTTTGDNGDLAIVIGTVLSEELNYWRRVAPGLEVGWEGDRKVGYTSPSGRYEMRPNPANEKLSDSEYGNLSKHFANTVSILHLALRSVHQAENRAIVEDLLTYWTSLPQLSDIISITRLCNLYLNAG